MKNYFYIVAIIIISFCGCSIDDSFYDYKPDLFESYFTASIRNEIETRATLVNYTPQWEINDEISIDGQSYFASGAGTTTTFSGSGATESTHHAYFPASIYNDGTPTLPSVQIYEAGKFNMPMYAESETQNLEFKNICGVLAISVDQSDINQVKSIIVQSDNKAMCGSFTVSSNETAILDTPNDPSKTVTLKCSNPIVMSTTPTIFYIAIPAQDYQYLAIGLSSDGLSYRKSMCTQTQALGHISIERNSIYNIDFSHNTTGTLIRKEGLSTIDTKWVQLWPGGPKFADRNIGATSEHDRGTEMNYYTATAEGNNYIWGNNWRTPTKDELSYLLNPDLATHYVWFDYYSGYTFWGKGAYSGNRLDFPFNTLSLWSSTLKGSNSAYYLELYDNDDEEEGVWQCGCNLSPMGCSYDYQMYVRPIAKEN